MGLVCSSSHFPISTLLLPTVCGCKNIEEKFKDKIKDQIVFVIFAIFFAQHNVKQNTVENICFLFRCVFLHFTLIPNFYGALGYFCIRKEFIGYMEQTWQAHSFAFKKCIPEEHNHKCIGDYQSNTCFHILRSCYHTNICNLMQCLWSLKLPC